MLDSPPLGGQRALRVSSRRFAAVVVALVAGFTLPAPVARPAVARPTVRPLPSNLESIRAQEATRLYGSPNIRPIDQRKTSLITMSDSEISGEGAGNYEPRTHQDGNWCNRSLDQAVWGGSVSPPTCATTSPVPARSPST
jgi:hypothetical protein